MSRTRKLERVTRELNLDDIAIFVRVVDHRGFASAARELGVPTSTVSRAITRLEEAAQVRLLQRSTRALRPTAEGDELYAQAASAITALRGAARGLASGERRPSGRLRITAPGDLCANFLADVIVAFADRFPQVGLDFTVTNQHSNLVDEGFDVGLRATSQLRGSSLICRKVGDIEHRLYASPRYLERHGTPTSPAELADHPCILFRAKDLTRTWAVRDARGETSVAVRGRIGGDDFSFVRAIALAGGGVAAIPHINCLADERAGRLVRVLPAHHLRGATLYIVYPSAKNVPARVTAFRDFVIEAFRAWSARSAT
jgi:DNA-binding transcriptional LysR family regulator